MAGKAEFQEYGRGCLYRLIRKYNQCKHINNAVREELCDQVVVAKFATTTQHGAIEGKTHGNESIKRGVKNG